MDSNLILFIALRAFTLLIGFGFAWMGYRLFMKNVTHEAGNLEINAGKSRGLRLARAAPGTFFAVLGAGIIVYSIMQVLSYTPPDKQQQAPPVASADSKQPASNTTPASNATGGGSTGGGSICDTCRAPLPHKVINPKVLSTKAARGG
ncbi:MAG TPA: hypothetical protein VE967_01490 [Gemmatimonadaceae bacterium]|nr:hypothetical protein [Gemmatimonadaceae bacterium]